MRNSNCINDKASKFIHEKEFYGYEIACRRHWTEQSACYYMWLALAAINSFKKAVCLRVLNAISLRLSVFLNLRHRLCYVNLNNRMYAENIVNGLLLRVLRLTLLIS